MDWKNEEAVLSRRAVLRGALAAAGSLLVPAALQGCSKKERAPAPAGSMPAPAPGGPSAMQSAAPAAAVKVSQASVQYQNTPKDGKKCADCMYFIAESNTCKLVEGQINPEGYCVLWVKKAT